MNINKLSKILFVTLVFSACSVFAKSVPQTVLIQNSGWMEPFYLDSSSQIKPLAKALLDAIATKETPLSVGSFSQNTPGNPSPLILSRSTGVSEQLKTSIANISLARKQTGVLADTDFKETLLGAIEQGLKGQSGIVWILTNNKNSPNNSQETRSKNQDFYDMLHHQDAISKIVAYPLKMSVKSQRFQANGIMIYGIAYGEEASTALQTIINSPNMKRLFSNPPARLKPLNQAAVRFVPESVEKTSDVSASLGADGKTLILNFEGSEKALTAHLRGRFLNDFFPYQIANSDISIELKTASAEHIGVDTDLKNIVNLNPGEHTELKNITLTVPPLPSMWNPEVIFGSGSQVSALLNIKLNNQSLVIAEKFKTQMGTLFPGDALPEVFVPPANVNSSTTQIPVLFVVNYPMWPLLLLIFAIALILILLIYILSAVSSNKLFNVSVNNESRKILIKALKTIDITDNQGNKVATLKRSLFGKPSIVWVRENSTVKIN